ncbi:recovery protein [Salix suchowensis]|nr:recovery protein [Salix suchowensis]
MVLLVAPNGIMYVKQEVRQGLLGRMLKELLDTRVMVKQAMKTNKENKTLSRILNARQLGLKYIANVTYGYTSATFSGRMPAVEIADSIVQSGRETLEKSSYLKGRTKEQAFRIGNDIADTITARNPAPIKLKFEKGRRTRSAEDDGDVPKVNTNISATSKHCALIAILGNFSGPKTLVISRNIAADRGQASSTTKCPSMNLFSPRKLEWEHIGSTDSRVGVDFLVETTLIPRHRKQLDAEYYITRVLIPPLERIFNLVGADVRRWKGEKRLADVHEVCASCASTSPLEQVECESLDCPWLYERKKGDNNEEYLEALRMLLAEIGLPKASVDSIVELDSDGTQTEVERDDTGSMTE